MGKFRFDYSQTMMMKLGIGTPDNQGGCKVHKTFEQALELIKTVDALTLGAPKIIYLVGWQYQGHDDKYPAFFEVNEAAAGKTAAQTPHESLLWLIEEAKKYHTTVSLHINLSDAYPNSPLWETYLKNDLILKNHSGKLKVTGVWNERTAYQVRFKEEYEKGFFQQRVDRLLQLIPLEELGTVHVDAFFVRKGKDTSIQEEKKYRRKMVEYFMVRGIDVTSEFIYREMNCGYRSLWGKSDIVGLMPAIWNLRMTQRDYRRYPPQLLAGGQLNMGIQWDKDLQYLFYGNCHGESSFGLESWQDAFTEEFALNTVPYFYLNQHKLNKITGVLKGRTAHFTKDVKTSIKNKSIMQNNAILKENETLLMPITWQKNTYYAWSKTDCEKAFSFPGAKAEIYRVTGQGPVLLETRDIPDRILKLKLEACQGYMIKNLTDQ